MTSQDECCGQPMVHFNAQATGKPYSKCISCNRLLAERDTRIPDCHCGLTAKLRTSQTTANPGRKYRGCGKLVSDPTKCNWFQWEDWMKRAIPYVHIHYQYPCRIRANLYSDSQNIPQPALHHFASLQPAWVLMSSHSVFTSRIPESTPIHNHWPVAISFLYSRTGVEILTLIMYNTSSYTSRLFLGRAFLRLISRLSIISPCTTPIKIQNKTTVLWKSSTILHKETYMCTYFAI